MYVFKLIIEYEAVSLRITVLYENSDYNLVKKYVRNTNE